jgi:hypothetical protein
VCIVLREASRAEACAFVALGLKSYSLRLGIGVDSARFEALLVLFRKRKSRVSSERSRSWVCRPCVRHGDRRESEWQ